MTIEDTLREFRFAAKPRGVAGARSIAAHFRDAPSRSGIYILGFANDQFYAGKSRDVTRRFTQHAKAWDDIAHLWFKPVADAKHDEVERAVIWDLKTRGLTIRNSTFTGMPPADPDLDRLWLPGQQERFLVDLSFNDATGERADDASGRARSERKYARFRKMQESREVVGFLRDYVRKCLPAYVQTEFSHWSLSCLAVQRPDLVVHSRLNIYWQQVLVALTDRQGHLRFHFFVALKPLQARYGLDLRRLTARHPGVEPSNDFQEPGGPDQVCIVATTEGSHALLADERFLRAAREFNLRLMKMGPCPFARFHNFALADAVLDGAVPAKGA